MAVDPYAARSPRVLVAAGDHAGAAHLEAPCTEQREAERTELLDDCDKYEAGLVYDTRTLVSARERSR